MSGEFMFCALVAVCLVPMNTVVGLPDGYMGRLDKPATVPPVQTMTVVKTRDLPGTPSAREEHMASTLPPAGHYDSTVVERRVVETHTDNLKRTPTSKEDQSFQGRSSITKVELKGRNGGLPMNQSHASVILQAMATKDPFKVHAKAPSNVDMKPPAIEETNTTTNVDTNVPVIVKNNPPAIVERNKSSNVKTRQPVRHETFEDQQLKVNTEPPPMGNHGGRNVMNNVVPKHEAGRGYLHGKKSSVHLEGINIPQLISFDGKKGNVKFQDKAADPAFGEREIKWIIKIQQIVFDGDEDGRRPASKSTNRKPHLGENAEKRINDGQDVFREIFFPSGQMRHLLEFSDKDNTDGGHALKEPDKDKGSLDSDTPAGGGDVSDEASTGRLSLDSPNTQSMILKAFKTVPETGGASSGQSQPTATSYGNTGMAYPFREDVQNDSGGPPSLRLPVDLFSKEKLGTGVEEAMASLKRNYIIDLLKYRNAGNQVLDYGNKNDDGDNDDDDINELIKGSEDDQRTLKSFQAARLAKRSAQDMTGDFGESVSDDNQGSPQDSQEARLYKRSVSDFPGDFGESVSDGSQGSPQDSQEARLYKRSVSDFPGDFGESVSDGSQGSPQDSQDARLYKRSVQDLPGDFGESVNDDDDEGSQKDSQDARIHKRSAQDKPRDSFNDNNEETPNDSQMARLYKRSARDMPRDSSESVNSKNFVSPKHNQDARLFKRSVQGMPGDFGEPVNDEEGSQRDSSDSRMYKRSVQDFPSNADVSSNDDNEGSSTDPEDGRLYKRYVPDMPDDSVNDGNEEFPNESQDVKLYKRSVQGMPGGLAESVNDDNDGSPKDTQDSRLYKRSVQDIPFDSDVPSNDDSEGSSTDSPDARLYKRSVQDFPGDGESVSADDEGSRKDSQNTRLSKRSVQYVPGDSGISVNDDSEGSPTDSQDVRVYKRSVPGMPGDIDDSVNDKNDGSPRETQDARLYKRSVQDVSGKYGVSVNDDNDGSPKEYDIEVDNGVKEVRFPADDPSAVVKREASSGGHQHNSQDDLSAVVRRDASSSVHQHNSQDDPSAVVKREASSSGHQHNSQDDLSVVVRRDASSSGHQHNSQERGYQHRNSSTWIDGAVKEARNSDNNKIQHGENGDKIFVSGEGSPTLVGLVLIPVNSDGTIKEDKDSDSTAGVQYHHLANHHRRPCNLTHGHHGSSHGNDHTGADGKPHPCHHGHRTGHHGRHRTTEHHVVGRTDSQPVQSYHSESHRSDEQHRASHSQKHGSSKHHPHHKSDDEKPYSESSEEFYNHEGEGHPPKSHNHGNNQPGAHRDEMIVESFRAEQITSGHGQRSTHAGNAVHVLVILSIFLICFTVILFLIVRSRSGGHVREINSRTALYVPQAKY